MFNTLNNRASTVPGDIRSCQSGLPAEGLGAFRFFFKKHIRGGVFWTRKDQVKIYQNHLVITKKKRKIILRSIKYQVPVLITSNSTVLKYTPKGYFVRATAEVLRFGVQDILYNSV